MSLVHSNVVLQALSSFTGVTVKPLTEKTEAGNELNVFNFLPTTFAEKAGDEPDSLFSDLYVDLKGFLDPKFDFDFTNLKDTSKCVRGNESYTRPCGWKRIAIKVLNKYTDGNTWLGIDGWRSNSVDGEWPVSYHGTSMSSAKEIVQSHYMPGSGRVYGRGIYSTPDIKEATKYSHKFTDDTGKTYEVLLQNRINPKMRKVCATPAQYWLIEIPDGTTPARKKKIVEQSIRPYGILFKEV